MATTDVAYTQLTANGATTQGEGTTLVAAPTNDMRIVRAHPEHTVLRVENTSADTDLTFTVLAGDYPPAVAAGQGNLVVTVPFGDTVYVGPVESGRFIRGDGTLRFTSSGTSGTVTALRVPKAA